jgi:hypothetical protein
MLLLDGQLARGSDKLDDARLLTYLNGHRGDEQVDALYKNLVLDREFNFQGKRLVFNRKYQTTKGERYVFVYRPNGERWPGTQPQTIVISDGDQRLLTWKEVGGSPILKSTTFELQPNALEPDTLEPIVALTCDHRHSVLQPDGSFSRTTRNHYLLQGDEIKEVKVEWLKKR